MFARDAKVKEARGIYWYEREWEMHICTLNAHTHTHSYFASYVYPCTLRVDIWKLNKQTMQCLAKKKIELQRQWKIRIIANEKTGIRMRITFTNRIFNGKLTAQMCKMQFTYGKFTFFSLSLHEILCFHLNCEWWIVENNKIVLFFSNFPSYFPAALRLWTFHNGSCMKMKANTRISKKQMRWANEMKIVSLNDES